MIASGGRPLASPAPGADSRKGTAKAPVQDCDLPARARGGLPPYTRTASLRALRPPGSPPAFPTPAEASRRTSSRRPAQQEAAGTPRGAAPPTQEGAAKSPAPTPRPPRRSDRKRPPPKPNLACESKRPKVCFAEGMRGSTAKVQLWQHPESKTAYHLTAAQLALIANAARGGGGAATGKQGPTTQSQNEMARMGMDWTGPTQQAHSFKTMSRCTADPTQQKVSRAH